MEQLGGKVRVNEQEDEIAEIGSGDSIDLALLRIPCNEAPPLLNTVIKGKPNKPVHLCGYGSFSGAQHNYILRPVKGRLGKSIAFESPGKGRVEAWDIHVKDDNFSKIQRGYSGSSLCDKEDRLIAVVSHEVGRTGERGYAVSVTNLQRIYPEIEKLIPSFSSLDPDTRIRKAKTQLAQRAFELLDVIQAIGLELDRMEEEGISSGDEEILQKIEEFIARQ